MMTSLSMIVLMMPIMFLFLNHPLSFGLILILQTLAVSLVTGTMSHNFWFSYILFLIMVGGMLVLFIYMTSIASNEKFKFSQNILMFLVFMLSVSLINIAVSDQYLYSMTIFNCDTSNFDYSQNSKFLTKFLNYPNYSLMFMMFVYLLITLIVVVKITKIKYGPIRQKF